jgi:hypothetical protein
VLLHLRFCRPAVSLPRQKRQGETRNSLNTWPDLTHLGSDFSRFLWKPPQNAHPKMLGLNQLVHHPVSKSDLTTTHFPNWILS